MVSSGMFAIASGSELEEHQPAAIPVTGHSPYLSNFGLARFSAELREGWPISPTLLDSELDSITIRLVACVTFELGQCPI